MIQEATLMTTYHRTYLALLQGEVLRRLVLYSTCIERPGRRHTHTLLLPHSYPFSPFYLSFSFSFLSLLAWFTDFTRKGSGHSSFIQHLKCIHMVLMWMDVFECYHHPLSNPKLQPNQDNCTLEKGVSYSPMRS